MPAAPHPGAPYADVQKRPVNDSCAMGPATAGAAAVGGLGVPTPTRGAPMHHLVDRAPPYACCPVPPTMSAMRARRSASSAPPRGSQRRRAARASPYACCPGAATKPATRSSGSAPTPTCRASPYACCPGPPTKSATRARRSASSAPPRPAPPRPAPPPYFFLQGSNLRRLSHPHKVRYTRPQVGQVGMQLGEHSLPHLGDRARNGVISSCRCLFVFHHVCAYRLPSHSRGKQLSAGAKAIRRHHAGHKLTPGPSPRALNGTLLRCCLRRVAAAKANTLDHTLPLSSLARLPFSGLQRFPCTPRSPLPLRFTQHPPPSPLPREPPTT